MNWNDLLPPSVSSFVSSTRKVRALPSIASNHRQLEGVRQAMLHALSLIEPNRHAASVRTRHAIVNAAEAQTLWYLRCDLLCLLSDVRGEPYARLELSSITEMFRGLVSESQLPPPRYAVAEAEAGTRAVGG